MAYKFVVLAALVAVANAGYLGGAVGYAAAPAYGYAAGYAAPSVAAIGQNTYRSYGNLGQVSTYSKALDTPYSSVRKSDVRVSNDAVAYGAAPVAYGGYGGYAHGAYAAPAVASYAAPAIASYAAPAAYGYAAAPAYARAAYAAPAYGYAAKVAAPAAIGVAYSAAPVVSHMSFTGLGATYGW